MDVEIRQLRYALAVADYRSFRRAAEALKVHQSALSRRVRDLENRIGVSLFERGRDGAHMTAAGNNFLRDVRAALVALEQSFSRAASSGRAEAGRLSIGYAGSLASKQMRDLLARFGRASVGIDLLLIGGTTSDLIQALFDRRLDVALMRSPANPPGLEALPLWRENIALAVPADHELCRLPVVRPEHLVGERLSISYRYDWADSAILSAFSAHVQTTFHECDREAILLLVSAGLSLAIVNAEVGLRFEGVTFLPLQANLPASEVKALWSPSADNPLLRRFLSMLRNHYSKAPSTDRHVI